MPILNNILTALALSTLFLMIAGLIRPALVLTWAAQKSRLRVLTVFGGLFLSLAVAASATGPRAIKQAEEEGHPIVKGLVPAAAETESLQTSTADMEGNDPKGGANKNQVGATEEALLQFLQKSGFKKQNAIYFYHPDASHPLRPYLALAYNYDSIGLNSFQVDNWYSDPVAAATLPTSINMKLESMETSLLTELLGVPLGNRLASVRKELIPAASGDVFSMTLNGRKLYGFVTSGGGSVVCMDNDSPLGEGRYRKTPKRII